VRAAFEDFAKDKPGWQDVLAVLSEPSHLSKVGVVATCQQDKEEILRQLRADYETSGRAPTRLEFISAVGLSDYRLRILFGSWKNAIDEAGICRRHISNAELLSDWGKAASKLGRIPTHRSYGEVGRYCFTTFIHRFGRWSFVPGAFKEFAQGKPEWADILAMVETQRTAEKL